MKYNCQFPGCDYSTLYRTQIHIHHIEAREHKGNNKQHNKIWLCPNHHHKIFIEQSSRGIHSQKGDDSIILKGWLSSTKGRILHYLENHEEKFCLI